MLAYKVGYFVGSLATFPIRRNSTHSSKRNFRHPVATSTSPLLAVLDLFLGLQPRHHFDVDAIR
jgi:hypothetical protein